MSRTAEIVNQSAAIADILHDTYGVVDTGVVKSILNTVDVAKASGVVIDAEKLHSEVLELVTDTLWLNYSGGTTARTTAQKIIDSIA